MFESLTPTITTQFFWVTAVFMGIYIYFKYVIYNYWNRNKIPYEEPVIPFGNTLPTVTGKTSLGENIRLIYNKFKKHRYYGIYMFHKPILMINDPELIRTILIKEFNKFPDRGLYFNDKVDPLSAHLFFLPGERWKHLRAKLSPTFTSGKLKQMYPLLQEVGDELVAVANKMMEEDDVIDVKSLVSRYTNDTIASIAFGINCHSLKNPDCDFRKHASKIFDQNPIKNALGLFAPVILDTLKIPLTPKEELSFFTNTFEDMIKQRHENHIDRKDFMNLLIQLMDKGQLDDDNQKSSSISATDRMTLLEATAQAFVFFIAGFETTSSTVTYAFYELAKNTQVQRKLQEEIDEVMKSSDGITYDKLLNGMTYLHMVFSETLRKHPSVPFLNRICVEDFKIPGSDFVIKKGTGTMISVTGLQSDPDIFPHPDKFDPERFNKENIAKRSPYVYLPFGDGPRICIGNRFGYVQAKLAMVYMLANFNFSISDKTPVPLNYSKRAIVQAPEGAVYLKFEKRRI